MDQITALQEGFQDRLEEQGTGEACTACDCELVLVSTPDRAELYVECDCGVVACIGPLDASRRLSPAA